MSETIAPTLNVAVCRKASELPPFAWNALRRHDVDGNVILPILEKCRWKEKNGIILQDHLWIVVFVQTSVCAVKLIVACTDGLTGKYPLFLFTPVPYAAMKDDEYIYVSLASAADHLRLHVPTRRIYSVFGRTLMARTFATIWKQKTNISFILDPYYDCHISFLTRATLEAKRREHEPIPTAQIRPAEPKDSEGVARLCYGFAATSVRYVSCYRLRRTQIVLGSPHSL
jgi:hypothetical protein